jgi:hypothetical protein
VQFSPFDFASGSLTTGTDPGQVISTATKIQANDTYPPDQGEYFITFEFFRLALILPR